MRPQFLIAGLSLNLLGTALAVHLGGTADFAKFLVLLLVIFSCQVAGAIVNDYADVRTDGANKNRTWFSGGSGVFARGRVGRETMVLLATFWTAVAVTGIVVLTFFMGTGLPLMAVMLAGLSLALAYSLGPLRLSYRALGELSMALMVSFLAPAVAFVVQMGSWDNSVLAVTIPLSFQMMALMMVVEYPDLESDKEAGKRTLVVRLGRHSAWQLGIFMLLLGGVAALVAAALGFLPSASITLALILLVEGMVFSALETTVSKMPAYFWSTAGTSGFYILAIGASAAVLYWL